jgi:glyoxylase-like metal-dependent hydrolase (beta-lactamase superfamily II)
MDDVERLLPAGVIVLERGWLSSNSVVIRGRSEAAVVDSGYWTHGSQTAELIAHAVGGLPLTRLVNTHLHSDHCGGNSTLQRLHAGLKTWIPPGLATAVQDWDPVALSYEPTGQFCPPFRFDAVVAPGQTIDLADVRWEAHAAPGHDAHSIVLFEPESRTLISADALWENGFGIVFEELEGGQGFEAVAATLELIEQLAPRVVIPGHGRVFADAFEALDRARSRLAAYIADPRRHATHAAKVLLKFKLLEIQSTPLPEFTRWAGTAPYFRLVHDLWFPQVPMEEWLSSLLSDLVRGGAARADGNLISNI